ncbi:MAG: hypothetical protein QOI00_970 [Chloroflexota bacterium]|nr:hypothetical protein [Chloroflexota bacterium]MEA2606213.1 hypothetical protein [Chloroflexota bacterium]
MQNMATVVLEIEPESSFDDGSQPFIEVAGIEGSRLRVTRQGLTVLPCTGTSDGREPGRFWAFPRIRDVRIDDVGALGVVRTQIRATGAELPLLLLEPDQITAARRALEMVWNLMSAETDQRIDA